jgi:hypothetical protein
MRQHVFARSSAQVARLLGSAQFMAEPQATQSWSNAAEYYAFAGTGMEQASFQGQANSILAKE